MKLPNHLSEKLNWIILGPMGPRLTLNGEAILAVDGGIQHTKKADFWVGDGDSSPSLTLPLHRHHLSREKDFSDFKAALDLIPQAKTIYLWGFLGGRRDHELAVFGECADFLKHHLQCRIYLYEEGKLVGMALPPGSGDIQYTGGFSLFVMEKARVRLVGDVLYQLPQPSLLSPFSSHGLSNRASGSLRYESEAPLFFIFGELT